MPLHFAYRPRCPACRAFAAPGAAVCAQCGRPLSATLAPAAATNDAGERSPAARRRFGEMLPRHWTPADSNGARRWGLSFGAGVVLFVVVSTFGAYMAIEAHDEENAWDRASTQPARESLAAASDALARRNAIAESARALVASLEAQIASARAEAAADAARLRPAPPVPHSARERHRAVPAATIALATPRLPAPAQRLTKPDGPTQEPHAAAARRGNATSTEKASAAAGAPPVTPPSALATRPAQQATRPAAARAIPDERDAPPSPDSAGSAHPPLLREPPVAAPSPSAMARPSSESSSRDPGTDAAPNRASPPVEPRPRAATSSCDAESGGAGCPQSSAAQPLPRTPRDSTPSAGAPAERAVPSAPAVPPARPLDSSMYRGASTAVKRRPSSPGADSASARHGSGHVGRHFASNSSRRRPKPEAASRPPDPALALPRVLSALLPPAFLAPPKPPAKPLSASFDLSDNQRTLYRGH